MPIAQRPLRTVALATVLVALAAAPDGVARGGDDQPRAIAAIEHDLVADDPAVRLRAAAELTDRFADGAVAVPMLVDLLDDEDPAVVTAAAKAIDSMAVAGAGPLTVYLTDEEHWKPGTWLDAVSPVTGLPSAFDTRGMRLEKDGPVPAEIAVCALLAQADETPWLLDVVRKSSTETRVLAASALAMHGTDYVAARGITPPHHPGRTAAAKAASALVRSKWNLRSWMGARIVGRLRSADDAVIIALADSLLSPADARSQGAHIKSLLAATGPCWALGEIGPAASAAAPILLDLVARSEDTVVSLGCGRALLRMGKETEVLALLSGDPPARDSLVIALASEGRGAATIVPMLIAQLDDAKGIRRLLPMDALAKLGPAASAALPALQQHAGEPDSRPLACQYADAILAISPADPVGLKLLDEPLEDTDPLVRGRAVATLARRAAPTPSVVARLVNSLAKDDGTESVIDAISRCGPAARGAVDDLARLAAAADERYAQFWNQPRAAVERRRAIVALGRIGPDAVAAVPSLTLLRDKGDETIRVPAAQAVRRIGATK